MMTRLSELSREQMVYQFKVKEGKIESRPANKKNKQTSQPLNDQSISGLWIPFPLLKNAWKEDSVSGVSAHRSLGILGEESWCNGQMFYSLSAAVLWCRHLGSERSWLWVFRDNVMENFWAASLSSWWFDFVWLMAPLLPGSPLTSVTKVPLKGHASTERCGLSE